MGAVGSVNIIKSTENKALQNFRSMSVEDGANFVANAYLDAYDNWEKYDEQGMNSNSLSGLIEHLGMHQKPVVLSDDDYDNQIDGNALGGVELYRGLGGIVAKQVKVDISDAIQLYQQQFLYGDKTFIGNGLHGQGLYFTTSMDGAKKYGDVNNLDKTTLTGFIDKSKAKVITEKDLFTMWNKESQSVQSKFDADEKGKYSSHKHVPTTYALYKGYNVVHVPGGNLDESKSHANGGQDFYIPLTREVLVMREHSKVK